MKMVLFREKYCPVVYVFETNEDWCRICLKLVKERLDQGWYYDPGDAPDSEPEEPGEDAPDYAREAYEKELKRYNRRYSRWREEKDNWDLIQHAAENDDLDAARRVIENRSHYEYEGYDIQDLKSYDSMPVWEVPDGIQTEALGNLLKRVLDDPESVEPDELKEALDQTTATADERKVQGGSCKYGSRKRTILKSQARKVLAHKEDGEALPDKLIERIEYQLDRFDF